MTGDLTTLPARDRLELALLRLGSIEQAPDERLAAFVWALADPLGPLLAAAVTSGHMIGYYSLAMLQIADAILAVEDER